jgi:TIR domain
VTDVAVFVSYRHDDDDAAYGRIKKISHDIRRAYKSLSGLEVELFFDTDSISLGDNWRDRIKSGLANATVFLAFISPLYLRSIPCREELQEFMSALSIRGSQKLIIPLLFTPVENISAGFQDDELWKQIASLQYQRVDDLRRADPGSGYWMHIIDRIAERMRQVLVISDVTVPASTAPLESEKSEPSVPQLTLIELFVTSQLDRDFEDFSKCATALSVLTSEYGRHATEAAPEVQKAESSSERLEIYNKLADELAPIVRRYSDEAGIYQHYSRDIDQKIQAIIRAARAVPREQRPDPIIKTLVHIKQFLQTSMTSMESIQTLYGSIDEIKGYSATLDKSSHRMESAIVMILGNRGVHRNLLEELEELGV